MSGVVGPYHESLSLFQTLGPYHESLSLFQILGPYHESPGLFQILGPYNESLSLFQTLTSNFLRPTFNIITSYTLCSWLPINILSTFLISSRALPTHSWFHQPKVVANFLISKLPIPALRPHSANGYSRLSPRGEAAAEGWPLPSGSEIKNQWSYTSTPSNCLHGVMRDNFASHRYNLQSSTKCNDLYNWINQLSNTTIWWLDIYMLFIT